MKIALTPTLVAIAWIGLMGPNAALAQNGGTPQSPMSEEQSTTSVAPSGEAAANAPTAPSPSPIDQALAIDNGLWEGASIGPGCPLCGGGCNDPADWYTIQGVRIISHGNLRKVPISFQTPENGVYQAELVAGGSGEFQVKNLDVTTARDILTSSGRIWNPYEVFNAKQFGLSVAPGYDVTIGHYFCRDKNNNDHFVEFSFWGLNSWSGTRTIDSYLIPVYNQNVAGGYTQEEATAINNGTLTPEQATRTVIDPQGNIVEVPIFVGSLRTPFPTLRELPGITDAQKTRSLAFNSGTTHYFSYRSTMNNFELNGRFTRRAPPDRLVMLPNGRWQRQCNPGTYMSYLYGLRFMQLDERFTFNSAGFGQWNGWEDEVQHANGEYDVVTHNSLLGLQVGADMTFRKCRWSWGLQSKLGPYINFANQISNIDASVIDGQFRDPYSQRLVKNRYAAALIGEVGFEATYKFKPNLIGRAGYDFMWITGVALAPEQLQFVADPVNRINTNGTLFSHGVKLGLEWLW